MLIFDPQTECGIGTDLPIQGIQRRRDVRYHEPFGPSSQNRKQWYVCAFFTFIKHYFYLLRKFGVRFSFCQFYDFYAFAMTKNLSAFLSIFPSLCLSLPFCLSFYLSVSLPIYLFACLPPSISVPLSAFLPSSLSILLLFIIN